MMMKLRVNRMQRLTGMHLSLVMSGTCSPRLVGFALWASAHFWGNSNYILGTLRQIENSHELKAIFQTDLTKFNLQKQVSHYILCKTTCRCCVTHVIFR